MKKIFAALFAITLVFSSVGSVAMFGDDTVAEAKSYKSGKKGFSPNKATPSKSNIKQDNKQNNKNQSPAANKTANNNKGGLMKGLMMGGLAGLLFGGLFGGMGALGSILGLLVNVAAILLLVGLVFKVWSLLQDRKRKQDEAKQWK